MSNPYIGEIRMFGGNFAPAGWAFCDGQLMPISENDALFTLIGTTFGGDGQETFGLPDLQGRVPLHNGTGPSGTTYTLGELSGTETVTLTTQQMPAHRHVAVGSTDPAASSSPQDRVLASLPATGARSAYGTDVPYGALAPTSLSSAGGSQPHDNLQPYTVVNFIISLFGIFPTQN
jgi:microcystin-dependent protein